MELDRPDRRDRLEQLAVEYALGTLTPPVRRHLAAIGRRNAVVGDELRVWELRLASLGSAVPPMNPPPSVWKGIVRRLGLQDGVDPEASMLSRLRRWRGFALASMLGTFGLGVLHFTAHVDPSRPTVLVVLAAPDARAAWIATAKAGEHGLILRAVGPIETTSDRSLQLWALPAGSTPRSLGLLPPSGVTKLSLHPAALDSIPSLAVSLEPRGGSPTGAPTGPVLYTGEIERI